MTSMELEKRIQALEDVEEIKKLHRQYVYWLNGHQWEEMVNCFTDDAVINIGKHGLRKGKEEITKLFTVDVARVNAKWNGCHFVTQPIINVDGDKATGKWFLCVCILDIDSPTKSPLGWGHGRYDCEYVKVGGEWKFSSLINFPDTW